MLVLMGWPESLWFGRAGGCMQACATQAYMQCTTRTSVERPGWRGECSVASRCKAYFCEALCCGSLSVVCGLYVCKCMQVEDFAGINVILVPGVQGSW